MMGKNTSVLCILCDEQSFVDLQEKIETWSKCENTTVVVTQNVKFAEEFADTIMIVEQGKLLIKGSREQLVDRARREQVYELELSQNASEIYDGLYSINGVIEVNNHQNKLYITVINGIDNLDQIISKLLAYGIRVNKTNTLASNLETVYHIEKVKNKIRKATKN